jgi:hypothetical protein
VNQLGASGSGTDYYTDVGTFSLSVNTEACNWAMTVATNPSGPVATPVTFSSAQIGTSGETEQFTVYGPWTMAWNYICPSSGNFGVYINGSDDIGPNELGHGGSGTDFYTDSGTFSLGVNTDACTWQVTISGSAPPPPPPPPTSPPPPSAPSGHGYWLVGSDGGIFSFGSAQFEGSAGNLPLQRPVVGITPTPDRAGYWLVASDGGVFAYGDTTFHGSIPGLGIAPAGSGNPNSLSAPIVGMVPSADGGGYFMVGADGGVFAFGDAHFSGSCPSIGACSGAAVAVMPDASGNGYWLVTTNGNVYAFGDAPSFGQPPAFINSVTSAVRTPDGLGYWILTSDGAVYQFGDANFFGSPLVVDPSSIWTAIFTTSDGKGYWVSSADGTVNAYGDAPNDGGANSYRLNGPIIAATGS